MHMGKGIDLARAAGAGVHADVIENFNEQLLIVFLKRLGGEVRIPVAEVDDTGQDLFVFSVNNGVFHFMLEKKQ